MEIHRRELFTLLRRSAMTVPAVKADACTNVHALYSGESTPEVVERTILRLVSASRGAAAPTVVFHCKLTAPHARSIIPIGLPCLALPLSFFILRALGHGAGRVILLPCEQNCHYGFGLGGLDGEVRFVHNVMDHCGLDRARLRVLPGASVSTLEQEAKNFNDMNARFPGIQDDVPLPFPYPSLAIASLLKTVQPAPVFTLQDGVAACGLARVDGDACSLCGRCARACVSKALTLEKRNGGVELLFNHAFCNGCGECVATCDDKALVIDPTLESRWLYELKVLAESPLARCRLCGRDLGPVRMHSKILETLARHDLRMDDFVTLCSACKFKHHLEQGITCPVANEHN